jgi:2-keto-4-pentenoate hydratase/2-oxohepta-3-ene-1,7-dioic acid hydratase in catechol pathway
MKLCRFQQGTHPRCGFYEPQRVLPIDDFAAVAGQKYLADAVRMGELERLFPIDSAQWYALQDLYQELINNAEEAHGLWLPRESVNLLPPIARPNKLLLLAGNYADHIIEQGGIVAERQRTFPYVFLKPASTTLVGDHASIAIPNNSPDKIDHEVELAIIIGKVARNVTQHDALSYVAGYTIINDLSDRGYRPNPTRQERPRDKHFDWLHGKWHDGFCPCGPNMTTSDEIADPQQLQLKLWVDDDLRQDGSTSQQIFDAAAVIEFLSSWITLEPGDIISTGTPSGVGNATGKYLKAGQKLVAEVSGIGRLVNYMT